MLQLKCYLNKRLFKHPIRLKKTQTLMAAPHQIKSANLSPHPAPPTVSDRALPPSSAIATPAPVDGRLSSPRWHAPPLWSLTQIARPSSPAILGSAPPGQLRQHPNRGSGIGTGVRCSKGAREELLENDPRKDPDSASSAPGHSTVSLVIMWLVACCPSCFWPI